MTVLKEKDDYRLGMIISDKTYYIIEKRVEYKWKVMFGVDSREQGHWYLDNPEAIENQKKHYNFVGYCILAFMVFSIIWLIIFN